MGERLGEGSLGVAFRATCGERQVVLQALSLRALESLAELDRLELELRALASLQHPAISPLRDVFLLNGEGARRLSELTRVAGNDDVTLIAVRAWIEGPSVDECIQRRVRHDGPTLERYLHALLHTLRDLHGLFPPAVHGATHPRNVFLGEGGGVALVDPGVSVDGVALRAGGPSGYAAPELLSGHGEPASDLHALGVTFLATVTHRAPGELPYERRTGCCDVRAAAPGLAPTTRRALQRMVEPSLARRARSADEVLRLLAGGRTSPVPPRRSLRWRRALVAAGAGLAVTAVALGVVSARRALRANAVVEATRERPPPAEPTQPATEAPAGPSAGAGSTEPAAAAPTITFAAVVRSTSGTGPRPGTPCLITVTPPGEGANLAVTCGDETLYDFTVDTQPCGAPPELSMRLREVGLAGDRFEYELVAVHGGELYLSTTERRAVAHPTSSPSSVVVLDVEPHSDRRRGAALLDVVHFREARRFRGVAFQVDGDGAPVQAGATCDVALLPRKDHENCFVEVRCGAKVVYAAKGSCLVEQGVASGLLDAEPSPIDGSGLVDMVSAGDELALGDETAAGKWSVRMSLRDR